MKKLDVRCRHCGKLMGTTEKPDKYLGNVVYGTCKACQNPRGKTIAGTHRKTVAGRPRKNIAGRPIWS